MTLFFLIAGYFALACLLAACLLLPALRTSVATGVAQGWREVWRQIMATRTRAGQRLGAGTMRLAGTLRRLLASAVRRWRLLALAASLLAIPPALVSLLRHRYTPDGFVDASAPSDSDTVIAALLQGEQLAPPPPLPPEVFTTAEVEILRPRLDSADRRWDLLDADFRQRLLLAYHLMHDRYGDEMVLLEGYRTPQRQAMLAAMGPQVTNAGAWQSYHQYGLAADSAFMRDGKLVISERDPWALQGYQRFGDIARQVGLTWGGTWRNADLGHVELRKPVNPANSNSLGH